MKMDINFCKKITVNSIIKLLVFLKINFEC